MADQRRAQGVAVAFTAGVVEQAADIAFEFAQLPFAGMSDLEPEALGRDLRFDFVVVDQT